VLHGLTFEQAITATAIAWAESGLRPDAVGDVDLEDETWGPSVGLYQIRSLRVDTGTGKERDVERLGDPSFNTRSMVAVSSGGTNWSPWSVFKNGRYLNHVDAVRAAVTSTGGSTMKFVSRSEWGARSPNGRTPAPDMIHGVGVHWLGPGSSRSDHSQCARQMREIQAFHMGPERGWADFAYNAAACRHGYVFEGRGPEIRNAANGGGTRNGMDANAAWASVLYLEGTDGPGLTAEGQDAINDAAEWLGVAGAEWLGHRDFLSTECPGDRIYGWVHSGHPRGNAPNPLPDPVPEEEDMALPLFGDAPDGRSGGLWMLWGGFRKRVHTTQVWDDYQRLGAKHVGDVMKDSGGKFPVAMFDGTIDIEAALAAQVVVTPGENGAIDYKAVGEAVADELYGRLSG
jgi:hypothetical protein